MMFFRGAIILGSILSIVACGSDSTTSSTVDPLYSDQWHLKNTAQVGADGVAALAGEDINVEPVWNSCSNNSCRGEGIRIAVVDDGLEIDHEDLKDNVVAGKSLNFFVSGSTDPTPVIRTGDDADAHGTSVAGIIAARDMNNLGGRGIAPRAELVGYNLVAQANMTDEQQATAMTHNAVEIHISNNSWGESGDGHGQAIEANAAWGTAIDTGLEIGRNGLGTIYVWAAGNGAEDGDNSNYDGQANAYGIIAVGALNNQGKKSSYSEEGANLLITGYGGEYCNSHTITTTDLINQDGYNAGNDTSDYTDGNYTRCFNGTSSATPVVAGVVALVLQANPNLGWRDVAYIMAKSARKNDPSDSDWSTNGAGYPINHKYGFGVVDAAAAVTLAKNTQSNFPTEVVYESALQTVNQAIGDNDGTAVSSTINVASSGISKIEQVAIVFSSAHSYSGDLEITLENMTTGTKSKLAETHVIESAYDYQGYMFSSRRHLFEAADGNWKLTVQDKGTGDAGIFESWAIVFTGH